MSHNKEAGGTTPTWSLPFGTHNHLPNAVPRGIYCLITTATTSNTIASLDTVVWFTPTIPRLRAKHFLASHHRNKLIRYKSSHGHKIDGAKPNQTGYMVGKKSTESRQKGTDKKIASKGHCRLKGTPKRQIKKQQKKQTKDNHITHVRRARKTPSSQRATQERHSYKQRNMYSI